MIKGEWFWLSRDKADDDTLQYNVSKKELTLNNCIYENELETFCKEKFENLTGIRLKHGQQVRVRLEIKEAK